MSDIIHLLPDNVANQIAAGEVIQRPASIIKELVENSIDADSHNINVVVIDAGKTCVQVIDDGKGMSGTDARLSFERHATSKIKEAADLYALTTMGFRGEALASIAAVAQVELRTRLHDEELGTLLTIEGGNFVSQEATSCAEGSNFMIRNLFYNVPARRKFLKSNQTELSNIMSEFEKIALVHPDVSFTLNSGESEIYNLPISSLRQRIMNVFGKKLNQQLLSVEVETSLVKISGFVGKPDSAKKKGAHQYFFVNGRYMRHPYFNKAVQKAFEQLIPADMQVAYFIYLEVDPSTIDVNIHPTKTEIKFENEQAIWQILLAAIKESLGKFNAVPTIDFDTVDRPDIPVFSNSGTEQASHDFNPFDIDTTEHSDYTPVGFSAPSYKSSGASTYRPKQNTDEWEIMYGDPVSSIDDNAPLLSGDDNFEGMYPDFTPPDEQTPLAERASEHYQYKGRFIMTAVKSGLMVIDQHRAHVNILYNRYLKQMEECSGTSQGMLFPEMIQLPKADAVVFDAAIDSFTAVGFEITNLGGGSYAVNGIPAGTEGLNAVSLLRDMIDSLLESGKASPEIVHSKLALSLASSAAIVAGQVLNNDEMMNMVDDLFMCESPNYTPDGKLVFSIVMQTDIEKLFN